MIAEAPALERGIPAGRLLLPLGLAVALSLFGDLALFASLAAQQETLGLTLAQIGILLSIHRAVRIPGNPLAGWLMDRFGRRNLFLLGLVLAVLSSASYGLVHGFWPFLFGRVGWGMAWALINVGGMAMVLDVSTPKTRGRLSGTYNLWINVGYIAGPLIGGFLVDAITFRPAMLACAAASALGLLIALLRLPETLPPGQRTPLSRTNQIPSLRPRINLRDSRLWTAMSLYGLTLFASDGIVMSSIILLLAERLGHNIGLGVFTLGVVSASGALIAVRAVLASLTAPLAGHATDRQGTRLPVITTSLLAGVASAGLLAWAPSLLPILAGILLNAVSSGASLAALAAYIGDATPPGLQGATMGLYATAGDVGSAAGPFLTFALVPVIGLAAVYLICAAAFTTGLGLVAIQGVKKVH